MNVGSLDEKKCKLLLWRVSQSFASKEVETAFIPALILPTFKP